MACDPPVPPNLYIPRVRDEFGKRVFLPPLCVHMGDTN